MIKIQRSVQILFVFLCKFWSFDWFNICWLYSFTLLFLLKLLFFCFIVMILKLILFLFLLLFVKRWSDNILPRFFETLFDNFFVLIEFFIVLFGVHFLFEWFWVFIIILRLISEFSKIDLYFRGSKVGVMIIFSDLLSSLCIFESNESEFSGLSFLIFGNFTVGNGLGVIFEMIFDLFLSEVFGYVFDDDSTHENVEMTILFIIIWI